MIYRIGLVAAILLKSDSAEEVKKKKFAFSFVFGRINKTS